MLRSIAAALRGDRELEDERLAGLIVAFLPLEEVPWAARAPGEPEATVPSDIDPLDEALERAEQATVRADVAEVDRDSARAESAEALAQVGEVRSLVASMATDVERLRTEVKEARADLSATAPTSRTIGEMMRAFRAGEIDDAAIDTTYMHKQGLLVPIAGRIFLVRDDEGAPLHLLFAAAAE